MCSSDWFYGTLYKYIKLTASYTQLDSLAAFVALFLVAEGNCFLRVLKTHHPHRHSQIVAGEQCIKQLKSQAFFSTELTLLQSKDTSYHLTFDLKVAMTETYASPLQSVI